MIRARRVSASLLLAGELLVERLMTVVVGAARLPRTRTRLTAAALLPRTLRRTSGGRLLVAYRLHLATALVVIAAPYLLAHVGA